MVGDNLNEAVGTEKIRDYIWYTETRQPFPATKPGHPYLLGTNNGTAYYFYYKPNSVTVLDYAFLATITDQAEGFIIYADRCALPESRLTEMGIVFKKIPRDITRL